MTVVRIAVPADEPELMKQCDLLERENAAFKVSRERVLAKLHQCYHRSPSDPRRPAICGVIGTPGEKLEGSVFLEIDTLWYSDDFGLFELWNYVHPEHRKTGHAFALIEFSKACALKLNLPLQMGIISNDRTAAKIRLYERRFGDPAGAFFLFNGHTGITVPRIRPKRKKRNSNGQFAKG